MLSLTSATLGFSAVGFSSLSRPTVAPAAASVFANENELEPEEGWNVDNLMEAMEMAETVAGGPTTAEIYERPVFNVKEMAGITGPLAFFDPLAFSDGASEGRVRFYREVEIKHGRLAMLATVGFVVGENFHPLWGGDIDVPSYLAFQETPLQQFWPAVVLFISTIEVLSVFSFETPSKELWAIKATHVPGDFGFDPLGLKPTSEKELMEMQSKELNNGRLAMIAAAGMIVQETFVTHSKLF